MPVPSITRATALSARLAVGRHMRRRPPEKTDCEGRFLVAEGNGRADDVWIPEAHRSRSCLAQSSHLVATGHVCRLGLGQVGSAPITTLAISRAPVIATSWGGRFDADSHQQRNTA